MALSRPSLPLVINTFDATKSQRFTFNYGNGDQVVKNNLVIIDNSNNTEIYNNEQVTFNYIHDLPSGTLINGTVYKVKIRVANAQEEWSQFSDEIIFNCFSIPVLSITNLGNVNSSGFTFESTFTQNEGDTLATYQYLLYDSRNVLISASPIIYDKLLKHFFGGFVDNLSYKLELKIITDGGTEASTGLLDFVVDYIAPQIPTSLQLENLSDTGQIKITTNIIRIQATIPSGVTYNYINGEEIDLTSQQLLYDKGISIENDFTMKIWARNLTNYNDFLILYGINDTDNFKQRIELSRVDNIIYCKKIYGNQININYEEIDLTNPNQEVLIWIQQENNLTTMKLFNV